MSYNTFPTFAGTAWDIKKRQFWSTDIETSASGAEFRTGYWPSPIYEFDITINYLSQTDVNTLQAFYIGQQGPFVPFLLQIPNDYQAAALQFATADGGSVTYQLNTPDGDAAMQIIGTPSIFVNGTQLYSTGTGTPAAPILGQTAGGAKAARTYYVRIEYIDAAGNMSAASVETSKAVSASNLLTVTSPAAAPGAVAWQVFISTATNSEQLAAQQNIGTNYTEPTGALPTNGLYNTVDRTTYAVSSTGAVTFVRAPAAASQLTWTGQYAYLVRFRDDNASTAGAIEINQFMNGMYEQTGITFRTVR